MVKITLAQQAGESYYYLDGEFVERTGGDPRTRRNLAEHFKAKVVKITGIRDSVTGPGLRIDMARRASARGRRVASRTIDGVRFELWRARVGGRFLAVDVASKIVVGSSQGSMKVVRKKYDDNVRKAAAMSR